MARNSDKDFRRFLNIALGSSFELETQLLIAKEVHLLNENKIEEIINKLNENQKMIRGLITKLIN